MDKQPILFWFRNDLRLSDNSALNAALQTGRPLVVFYIYDSNLGSRWSRGSASLWWLHHSLKYLSSKLDSLGGRLYLFKGETTAILDELIKKTDASALFFARQYAQWDRLLEDKVQKLCGDYAVDCRRFAGYLLNEPDTVLNKSGQPYKVFTPYWRAVLSFDIPPPKNLSTAKLSKALGAFSKKLRSDKLAEWKLLPRKPNWARGFDIWVPGEQGAKDLLSGFVKQNINRYEKERDFPAYDMTSQLSAHLHFGELSPRQIWAKVKQSCESEDIAAPYLRQIVWREFSYHLLYFWPSLLDEPFKDKFAEFPWKKNKKWLISWQKGLTGFPIIDAGMRQLWAIGWMHNRVRMIVASLLVKNLMIPWQEGERWFWDTLVDADPANNAAGWQWVAGCGADAAPYFRIFNPARQSLKFDAEGDYIRKWVPELRQVPDKYIHEPSTMNPEQMEQYNCVLGSDYPYPIVDLGESRENALAAYHMLNK